MEIINQQLIRQEIEEGRKSVCLDELLEKAGEGKGLSAGETSSLYQNLDEQSLEKALQTAASLKSKAKGDLASFYTCLYITNECLNDCSYCGYRKSNSSLARITLTGGQIREEVKAIKGSGVTNVILIGGTAPEEMVKDMITKGTSIVKEEGLVPWLEFENLSLQTLKEIQDTGADHYVLFQETYDREKYEKIHKNCLLKRNYHSRLDEVNKAIESGFKNINIGALFGLSGDNLFDVLGLYHHARYLISKGVKICISVPTLKPAPGLSISKGRVSSQETARIFTILRLSLPEVSLALSGREDINLRNRLFGIVDQIGTGGVPNPGGRTAYKAEYEKGDTQFKLYDSRSPREIKEYLQDTGIIVVPFVEWG